MSISTTVRSLVVCTAILILLLAVLLLGSTMWAKSGGEYDLSWSSINAGGGTFSTGGEYILGDTIGQTGAGMSEGGDYLLDGGFWHCFPLAFPDCQEISVASNLYLPVLRSSDG